MENIERQLGTTSVSFPPTYWLVLTNVPQGWTEIIIPLAGTLWVFYEWGLAPAKSIEVWHQGGTTTPVRPGENSIRVGKGDSIRYQLYNPATESIKIGYQLLQ